MKQSIFDELKQSMKEAVQIARGEAAPSRTFTVEAPDVKAIREQTGLSQAELPGCCGLTSRPCKTGSSTDAPRPALPLRC